MPKLSRPYAPSAIPRPSRGLSSPSSAAGSTMPFELLAERSPRSATEGVAEIARLLEVDHHLVHHEAGRLGLLEV